MMRKRIFTGRAEVISDKGYVCKTSGRPWSGDIDTRDKKDVEN